MMKKRRKRSTRCPQDEARVGIGDRAGDPQGAGGQLPDEVVDEVLSERAATKGHDEEGRPADLQHQIAGDEQPARPANASMTSVSAPVARSTCSNR
jgi:hypothetical protein